MKKKLTITSDRLIAERLEPRVLFSADPLGLAVGALLLDDQTTYDTPEPYEPFSEINIAAPESDHASAPVELIFIDIRSDTSRADIQALIAQDNSNAFVHVIDSQTGGINSISNFIAQHESVSSIHFLTHGDNQGLRLGTDWLDVDSIGSYKEQLSTWQHYLTADADVLLYGCDLTAGTDGLNLIEKLAVITGADVAASNDTTGHESLEGNWELESTTGSIEAVSLGTDRVQLGWTSSLALIQVDTFSDTVDAGDGLTSLREAIIAANSTPGEADLIQLQAGTYNLTITGTDDVSAVGDLDITDDLDIYGASGGGTIINAAHSDRVLDIFDADVSLENLEISGGQALIEGGGIRIQGGDTTLHNVVLVDNESTGSNGGGIFVNDGNLAISDSTFSRNNASIGDGGAIYMQGTGTLDVSDSELYDNHAVGTGGTGGGNGGAIALYGGVSASLTSNYIHDNTTWRDGGGLLSNTTGSLSITSTTFESNNASSYGGGAYIVGDVTITGSTFSANSAKFGGGGLTLLSGETTVNHSTFTLSVVTAGGSAVGNAGEAIHVADAAAELTISSTILANNANILRPDVGGDGAVTSNGFNLLDELLPASLTNPITPGTIVLFNTPTDIVGGSANLGALIRVDGNPPTHTPQAGSDAIDSGGARSGSDANGSMANTFSDIGAVEANPAATGKKLFWADSNGWIYRANEDGSAMQQIFQTDNPPGDIEYDSGTGRIFWSETDGQWGSLRSTDINGGDLQEITSTVIGDRLMSPTGIAIDAVGRFLYVHADVNIDQPNATWGAVNKIDRYIINNDGILTWDSEIYAGSPFSNPEPQISQPIDLEYTPNLDGREALIWNEAGKPAGLLPEVVPQINVWDLTPGPNTNPNKTIVPIPEGTFDARALAVDPVSGTVYFTVVDDNITAMTLDLDAQVATYTDAADDEFLFGLQFDESTDTLWWTEVDGTNGSIGTFLTNLSTYDYRLTYSGSPVALALADITPGNAFPTVDVNTGVAANDIPEAGIVTIDDTMLHAVDDQSSADDIIFTVEAEPTIGSLLLNGLPIGVGDNFTQAMLDGTSAGGPLQYQHDGTEVFTDQFIVSVTDDVNGPNPILTTISIAVSPVSNYDPVANSDAITVTEGNAVSVLTDGSTTSVLVNDTDADAGDTMTAAVKSGFDVQHGTLVLATNGTFTYAHDDSENLVDQFTYIVTDADGRSSETIVAITVTPVSDFDPVANTDAITVTEGNVISVLTDGSTTSVLVNDTDADAGDTMSAAVKAGFDVQFGTLTLATDGTFTYTHDGSENLIDQFTYIVTDAGGRISESTVAITIAPISDFDPIANSDAIIVTEGAATSLLADGIATSVLANDTDADAEDTMSAAVKPGFGVQHGTLTLGTDGTFTYTHNDSENHTDQFTYILTDAGGRSSETTVVITVTPVNDNTPSAVADSYFVFEGGVLADSIASVLDNDTDADIPDSMTAALVTSPSNGTLTLNTNGTFTYIHNGSETTTDQFTYTANDAGIGVSSVTTVSISITLTNDNDPIAVDDVDSVDEGGLSTFLPSGFNTVLHNDSDVDVGDLLTPTVTVQPNNGTITLNADGTFLYTHDGSETLTDSYVYTLTDTAGRADTATVQISIIPVNDNVPVTKDDAIMVAEGSTINVLADNTTATVLANDSDLDLNDAITASIKPGADITHGMLQLNTDGSFSYAHDGSENFNDQFTYIATDSSGNSSEALVSITINPINDNTPVLPEDQITLTEGATATEFDSGGNTMLSGLIDADVGDTATITIDKQPDNGILSINPDYTFSYTHNGGEQHQDNFSYFVTDADNNQSASKIVNIIVGNANDAPVISLPVSDFNATERELFTETLPSNLFVDSDDDQWNILLSTPTGPLPAWLTFDPQTQILTGTPSAVDLGTLTVHMQAKDTHGALSEQHSFMITVGESAIPDQIAVANTHIIENSAGTVLGPLTLNGQIVDSDATVTISDERFEFTQDGQLALKPDSVLDFEAEASLESGPETGATIELTITASDEINREAIGVIILNVVDANDKPEPNPLAAIDTTAPVAVPAAGLTLPSDLFIDPDKDDLLHITAQLEGGGDLPSWLSFDVTDQSFSVIGTAKASLLPVEIIAVDLNGAETRTLLTLQFDLPAAEAALPESVIDLEPVTSITDVPKNEIPAVEEAAPEVAAVANEPDTINLTVDRLFDVIEFEHIDIASLIKPLPRITAAAAASSADFLSEFVTNFSDNTIKAELIDEFAFELLSNQSLDKGLAALADSFDQQKELLEDAYNQSRSAIGRSITLTSGLSVGYLIWLIRGGTLMGSVLSSMPAWRLVDPLPILGSLGDDFEDSDDSLESMIENS
ncbi:MAG: Ig-like domain-containing protein [Granulosicoccaceae bacterium]